MTTPRFFSRLVPAAVMAVAVVLASPRPAAAYVEVPITLGDIVKQSTNIVQMQVTKVDREKNLIIYKKLQDIKGKHPQTEIKHNIGRGGLRPGEWEEIMKWAEVGKQSRPSSTTAAPARRTSASRGTRRTRRASGGACRTASRSCSAATPARSISCPAILADIARRTRKWSSRAWWTATRKRSTRRPPASSG